MKHHPFTKLASIFVVCLMTFSSAAFADEAELMSLVKNMQKQMNDLQSTVMAQKSEIDALKNRPANVQMGAGATSPEVTPPMSEAEFNQRLGDRLGGADKWLKDLKFSGDLRLRYEAFHLHDGNPADTNQPDRNRFRFRLRYGFEKTFNPEMKVGFSMASGEKSTLSSATAGKGVGNADPISTNQSMTGDFNFKNIWIEKAYATYTPEWAKVSIADGLNVSGLEVTAGKFTNPFERGSTDMIWDRDLKPEGIYEKVDVNLLKTDNLTLKAYGTAGQFILNETGTAGSIDSNLWAFQVGLNPIFYVPGMERPVDALSALSIYDYQHYADHTNFTVNGISFANGNYTYNNGVADATRLDAQQFNTLAFYQEVAVYPYGIPVRPFFEFARNMASQATLTTDSNNAWSAGMTVGKLQKKGDWQAGYQYKWIGASSVVGAFNDSDFGGYNYGGVAKAGSVVKLGYNLTDYLTANAAAFLVSPISSRNSTANGAQLDEAVRRFQLDLTYKF